MLNLKLKTSIHQFEHIAEFAQEFNLSEKDLVLTNEFLYQPFIEPLHLSCHFLFQEKFGQGEPSDEMIDQIIEQTKPINFNRIIAIGGGTIIDISKILVLDHIKKSIDAFTRKVPLKKGKELVIIPTTCGTGSEVTNISIAEIKSMHTKMGLADDLILADHAVLIPELLKTLPFKFFATSAIDALIHATESYVSPNANIYTETLSIQAIKTLLDVFQGIASKGQDYRLTRLQDCLTASNMAGIAFGNAGVGAVHALSYPLGGTYHVPHGESNFQFFTAVFQKYLQKNPKGKIKQLNQLLSQQLSVPTDKVYSTMDQLLNQLIPKKPLKEYGMKKEEVEAFSQSVLATQQRLLKNNYTSLDLNEIEEIYLELY